MCKVMTEHLYLKLKTACLLFFIIKLQNMLMNILMVLRKNSTLKRLRKQNEIKEKAK